MTEDAEKQPASETERLLKELNENTLKLLKLQKKTAKDSAEAKLNSMETVWANVFHDTVAGSDWYTDRRCSLGRWAIGYPMAYILFRILDDFQPKNILELGMGESTKIISQYANHFDAKHTVVESNSKWIEFFSKKTNLAHTDIVQLDWVFEDYKGNNVRVFGGFKERFEGCKFDLIVVDAPLGGDMKVFSRIDVLRMMPDILSDDFLVLIDDCERPGETATVKDMCALMTEKGVGHSIGKYSGAKTSTLITSDSLSHFCTL